MNAGYEMEKSKGGGKKFIYVILGREVRKYHADT